MGINHGDSQGENINGEYGSRSQIVYMLDRDDRVRGGRSLDTLGKRGSAYGFYSSSGLDSHYGC